jgi:site-specific recombinase XerD
MILSTAVEQYIQHKRSLGMGFLGEAERLRAFVQAIGDCDMRYVNPASVKRFLEGHAPLTSFWFSKYHTLNAFYRYALARKYCSSSPLPLNKPQKPEPFQPYIYTNRDIERLIDAADSRHRYVWLLEPHTVRTLLLLLYGTGLRISEALYIKLNDFDADAGILTVRQTKFFKSRFVPVGSDLSNILRNYIDRQWSEHIRAETTPLLGTCRGEPIRRQTAELVFKRLREEAGVSRSKDARYQPRLHDLRHTFAVVRLVTWYREGKNVQRLLPHLSTYLGHARLVDTQRYLTMTIKLLEEASNCFELYARPEVSCA